MSVGVEADLAQAGEVLARGVQHPLVGLDGVVQFREVADGGRVEQEGARAAAVQLNQIGALRVAEAGCPFGVDGDGAVSGADRPTAAR